MTNEQLQRGKAIEKDIAILEDELAKVVKLPSGKCNFKVGNGNYGHIQAGFLSLYPINATDFINQYIFNINLQISKLNNELSKL